MLSFMYINLIGKMGIILIFFKRATQLGIQILLTVYKKQTGSDLGLIPPSAVYVTIPIKLHFLLLPFTVVFKDPNKHL